jgi:hypothetical protein
MEITPVLLCLYVIIKTNVVYDCLIMRWIYEYFAIYRQ